MYIYLCKCVPAIGKIGFTDFIFGTHWRPNSGEFGIFPMIVASIYVTAGAIVIGVPIGILTAVFLACYCPNKIYKVIKPLINLLASIPSVVYGFFCLDACSSNYSGIYPYKW